MLIQHELFKHKSTHIVSKANHKMLLYIVLNHNSAKLQHNIKIQLALLITLLSLHVLVLINQLNTVLKDLFFTPTFGNPRFLSLRCYRMNFCVVILSWLYSNM